MQIQNTGGLEIDNRGRVVHLFTPKHPSPPDVPLNFGSLETLFKSAIARHVPPANPAVGDIYLDDGTNTSGLRPGFRRFDGAVWQDLGGVTTLASLTDTDVTTIQDGERLVYDVPSGKWRNEGKIDGGAY